MRMLLPLALVLAAPLLLMLLAGAPALEPVRRAFRHRKPAVALDPDERLLARIRPDPRVLAMLGLFLIAATLAAALVLQLLLGATPLAAYLTLLPFTLAGLIHLAGKLRCRWLLTDRRVITELGACLPLAEVRRIAFGPTLLRLDGRGAQSLRLTGLPDAPAAARMIRQVIHHNGAPSR